MSNFPLEEVQPLSSNGRTFSLACEHCFHGGLSIIAHELAIEPHFLLNQGMSRTLRGTLSVEPFRPSSDLLAGTVLLAAAFAFEVVFFAAPFVFAAAFLAVLVAFLVTDFAAPDAFIAVFFVAALALLAADLVVLVAASAALAADATFFATAALSPASCNFLAPALEILPTESNFAATSFLAVAAPTPGSAVNASIFEEPFLPAMVSLVSP